MIFLAGGGNKEQSFELDKQFFSSSKVLYIPFAMSSDKYTSCEEWFSSIAEQFNTPFDTLTAEQDISEYDTIYIGGGNTFELVRKLKKHNIWDQLKKHLSEGKDIYGGSAGAIILGKTILTAQAYDEEMHKVDSYDGLDVLNGYSVWPHYKENQNSQIFDFCAKHNAKILAIPEESGVISNQTLETINKVFIFENNSKQKC